VRRFFSGLGQVLITAGVLLLLFVGYQLWGTGLYTAQQQSRLGSQFRTALEQAGSPTTPQFPSATTVKPTTPTTTTTPPPSPPEGEAVAHIVIPKIGVDKFVVEGVDTVQLRKGPGHYPATSFPGQQGNAGIAGHRTTYGAPFGNVDLLENGDEIDLTTLQGSFVYRVYEQLIVLPNDGSVLDPDPTRPAILTLTSCHPKFSAAQRIVVHAELEIPAGDVPLPAVVRPSTGSTKVVGGDLGGPAGSKLPTVLAGIVTAMVGGLWWFCFRLRRRWWVWLAGVVPFLAAFFVFCFYLEQILPNNI